jgi:hypothetical protein
MSSQWCLRLMESVPVNETEMQGKCHPLIKPAKDHQGRCFYGFFFRCQDWVCEMWTWQKFLFCFPPPPPQHRCTNVPSLPSRLHLSPDRLGRSSPKGLCIGPTRKLRWKKPAFFSWVFLIYNKYLIFHCTIRKIDYMVVLFNLPTKAFLSPKEPSEF